MPTSQAISDYALTYLNDQKADVAKGKASATLVRASEIAAVTARDHAGADGELFTEVKVTYQATGAVVYLPVPEGWAEKGTTATAPADGEGPSVSVPDDLDGMFVKDLRPLAGSLGLTKGGTKDMLIARIKEYAAAA